MSGTPFGFRPEGEDDDDRTPAPGEQGGAGGPVDPFGGLLGALGGAGGGTGGAAPDLGAMLQQLGRMLSWKGGPVNWDLAREAARNVVQAAGDRSVPDAERRAVEDAFRLADLWLDDASAFPAGQGAPLAWSRAEWVEGTQEGWQGLVEPVAARVSETMQRTVPAEMVQAVGPLLGMMQQLAVSMWGAQVCQGIGQLATEVCGATDVGIPLGPAGRPALVPANVRAFGEGLGLQERDVLVYLALREAAHLRLHAHAPWLRAHVLSLVEEYARHVEVDTDRIEASLRDLDPQRPEAIQEAIQGGLFDVPTTPVQQAALDRLELALALVEGWVDDVVTLATADRLPAAAALGETVRRRRATGGPAEQTFATLVGLQLRPRRMREAAAFWAAVRGARGVQGRDAVWAHPDLLPSPDDLGDPSSFLRGTAELDVSALDDAGAAPEPGAPDTGAPPPDPTRPGDDAEPGG
jgi:putative hydrolase